MFTLPIIITLVALSISWFLIGYYLGNKYTKKNINELQLQNQELKIDTSKYLERIEQLNTLLDSERTKLTQELEKKESLQQEIGEFRTHKLHLEDKLSNEQKKIKEIQEQFKLEFENIANKLLKMNSNVFAESNQKQMTEIIAPLKEKITAFEKRVNDVYTEETKQRSELKQQLLSLMELNKTISEDAQNLTKALKGDSKMQGNWGELILERVLESSGLVKDQEYFVQVSATNAEGKRIQPDVVVKLPDDKHIIIDSKVSLTAYEQLSSTEDAIIKENFIKDHLTSIRSHIKSLSEKKYEHAPSFNSPDFVLLFMPLEGAFSLAMQQDATLYALAWKHNIVLVSPTTLLATLKTIASIWKQEKQTKNAIEIAERAGNLYDKFVGFLSDMEQIDKGLLTARKSYEDAKNKLSEGKGNLVSRVEYLRKLGAKAKESKSIPSSFDINNNEDEA